MKYQILTDELTEKIANAPEEDQGDWLILEAHPEFEGYWIVNSLDEDYFEVLEPLIGPYRAIHPTELEDFLSVAEDGGYEVVFGDDPEVLLAHYKNLTEPPPFKLDSTLPNTVDGFLPFQLEGFNFLKDKPAGIARWSTGTGKSVLLASLAKYHIDRGCDYVFIVPKGHNKINLQRTLTRLLDLDSGVLTGTPKRRAKFFDNLEPNSVVIMNYEKFKVDYDYLLSLFTDNSVAILWDEIHDKLSNRQSQLYTAVAKCIYKGAANNITEPRSKSLYQTAFTATPVKKDPEGYFNWVRILDHTIFGKVDHFRAEFAQTYNYFNPYKVDTWQNLDKLYHKTRHITHQADKETDPAIKAQFPTSIEDPRYIEWDDRTRALYDSVESGILDRINQDGEIIPANILGSMQLLQMLCNAPSMVVTSMANREASEDKWYERWEAGEEEPRITGSEYALELVEKLDPKLFVDDKHPKKLDLQRLVTERWPNDKGLIYTTFNDLLLPVIGGWLEEWGINYVTYIGTDKQKQDAQDRFKKDDSIHVFLSSDSGSDSLDLEEAVWVDDYDLPWNWITREQRHNRANRITSTHETNYYHTQLMVNSVEDRRVELQAIKKGYHEAVTQGKNVETRGLTKQDYLYLLTGQWIEID